jgi:cell division protein FtsQ
VTDRHPRDPDPAALDELSRAFGDVEPLPAEPEEPEPEPEPEEPEPEPEPEEPEPEPEPKPEPEPAERVPESTEPESAEPEPEPAPEPTEPAPKVIRIDDIVGSVEVRDAAPAGAATASAPPPVDVAPASDEIVVIAVEDDLPDAVYVAGSLDRDGSRSIVFIEDDDTGDTMAPEAGRDGRRGIEPRMRERRVAVKRAQSRKRLKWVLLASGIVIVAVTALAVLGSPLFAVRADQVTVTGNVYTDPDRLEEIVDDLVGTPALRVDAPRLERELEAIPWVERATVTVDFPHSASIDIRERAAMTTFQGPDGRFRVLDRDGRVLDVIDLYPFAYLLINGPDPVDLEPGDFAPAGYAAASELAKNLTPSIRGRVEYVDVTADGSRLVLHLDDGSEVFFGEARDFFAKLLRLESVLAANPDREPGPIDVSTDDVTL